MEKDRPALPEAIDKKDKKKNAKDKVVDFYRNIISSDIKAEAPPENNSRVRNILRRASNRLFPKVEEVEPGPKTLSDFLPDDTSTREATESTSSTAVAERPDVPPFAREQIGSESPEYTSEANNSEVPHDFEPTDIFEPENPTEPSEPETPPETAASGGGEAPPESPLDSTHETSPEPPEAAPPSAEPPELPPDVASLPEDELHSRELHPMMYDRDSGGDGMVYDRAAVSRETPAVERIIETNHSAAVGLVSALVVDRLSRGRDRKLDKKIHGLDRKNATQDQKLAFDRSTIERIEKQNAATRERLNWVNETQRNQTQQTERQGNTINRVEQLTHQRPENSNRAEQVRRQPEVRTAAQPDKLAYVPMQPEAIQKKVAAAAEQNLPIENYYERRHEVKDNQKAAMTGGAGATGNVSAGGLHSRAQHDDPLALAMQQAMNQTDQSVHPLQNGSYRKAMTSGVVGAGVILVILGLMLLLG